MQSPFCWIFVWFYPCAQQELLVSSFRFVATDAMSHPLVLATFTSGNRIWNPDFFFRFSMAAILMLQNKLTRLYSTTLFYLYWNCTQRYLRCAVDILYIFLKLINWTICTGKYFVFCCADSWHNSGATQKNCHWRCMSWQTQWHAQNTARRKRRCNNMTTYTWR